MTRSALDDFWDAQKMIGHEILEPDDPGLPATYGTATGGNTLHPWSAVDGARHRKPRVVNLNKLRASVFAAIGHKE